MTQFTFNLKPERKIWSVSELTERIRDLLAGEFFDVWVEGEISNCHVAQSGHLYFTLKDERAQLRCVCFRDQCRILKFKPEDGLRVTVRGSINVYVPRGDYQLYVELVEPVGLGALQLAFEQLKKRLQAEGLFDSARKKPLPVLPQRIGLVTSPAGAAVRDIVRILRRRFPGAHLIVYPVRVQGEGAAREIVEAIGFFSRKHLVDVMILARGGGSLEDLWTFNEEILARAISAALVPIITGVGHEADFTIADFVADVRASTPSAAAEIVVKTRQEFDRHVAQLREQLSQRVRYLLLNRRHRVQELAAHRGFRRLQDLARQYRQQNDELAARLGRALERRFDSVRRRVTLAQTKIRAFDLRARIAALRLGLEQRSNLLRRLLQGRLELTRRRLMIAQTRVRAFDLPARIRALHVRLDQRSADLRQRLERALVAKRQRLERLRLQLEERSPLRVLERGYAIVYDAAGNVLRDADAIRLGEEIAVRLHRGRIAAEVKKKETG